MQEEKFTLEIFPKRLLAAIGAKSLNQKELSLRTQIAQSAISKYLAGKALPRTMELCKLAQALGCSMDWLCGLEQDNRPADALRDENVRLRTSLAVAVGTLKGSVSSLENALITLRQDLETPQGQ